MQNETNMHSKKGLTLVRKFNAPLSSVFGAFSNAEALAQWWGPEGMKITVKHFDFKEGGTFHYSMTNESGSMWGLFKYVKIEAPGLIDFINSFSDENGAVCKAPFDMDFPLEIMNHLRLEEENGVTTLTISGYPVGATRAQEDTYFSIMENMEQGFNGTFNQLERYLAKQV